MHKNGGIMSLENFIYGGESERIGEGDLTEAILGEYADKLKKVFFDSQFNFLKANNGFRPGNLHVILGSSGVGKSTLTRSLIGEASLHGKTLVILSEEKATSYVHALKQLPNSRLNGPNCRFLSQIKYKATSSVDKDEAFLKELIEEEIALENVDIIFYDNLTTSSVYERLTPDRQFLFCTWLKGLAIERDIPIVIIAHSNIKTNYQNSSFVKENDIRGTKGLSNLAEYFYAINKRERGGEIYCFIEVLKSRDYNNRGYYLLKYEKEQRIFSKDGKKVDLEFIKSNL